MKNRLKHGIFPVTLVVFLALFSAPAGLPARGETAAGRDPFARCEALLAEGAATREPSSCVRAITRESPELYDEAVHRLDRWHAAHPDNPWLPYDLASLEWTRRTSRVPDLYTEAAELFTARGDLPDALTARLARARFLIIQSEFEEAQEELNRMAALLEGTEDLAMTLRVDIESARKSYLRRELEEAHRRLYRKEVVSHFRGEIATGLRECYGDWLVLAAQVEYETGRYATARHHLLRWLEELGDEPSKEIAEASVRYLLAAVHVSSALPSETAREEALTLLRQALEAARRANNTSAEIKTLRMLGKMVPGSEGEWYLRRCVERAEEVQNDPSSLSLCHGSLASRLAATNPEEARRHIDRALEVASKGDAWDRTFADLERLRVDWEVLPRNEAVESALATLDRLDRSLDEGSPNAELEARVRAEWLDPGYWVAGRLLGGDGPAGEAEASGPEDLRRAFEVAEHMRARALKQALRAAEGGDTVSALPALQPATLARVEERLEPDQALLSYLVGSWRNLYGEFEGGVWLLATTRGGTRVYRLPERTAFEPDGDALATLEDPEAVPLLLTRLHRQLLEPALEDLPPGIRHLVIVPDGALHRLPFALLRPRQTSTASLAARYEISLVPSASLWLHWRSRGRRPFRSPVLVLADPALGALTAEARTGEAEPGSTVRGGRVLGPLPYARREGREVVRRLGGGELRVGEAASERALKSQALAPRYAVLHLAVHAVADERRPERSAVFLAPGGGEDGRLTPAEILRLDLRDRLVVLAACETAAGEVLRGEGPLSLARYFFQAGARAVVAGLWDLPDAEGADLFGRFYGHLGAGETVAGALAAAQREHLTAGGSARTWGGLVVLGDGAARPFLDAGTASSKRWISGLLPVTVAAGAAAALILLARVRRRRRGGVSAAGS